MNDPDTEFSRTPPTMSQTAWSRMIAEADSQHDNYGDILSRFCGAHWRPVYLFIRRDWSKSNEEAKDLTQDFFSKLWESGILRKFTPERGRLRTFLKVALKNFLVSESRREHAARRGGDRKIVSFDDQEVERLSRQAVGGGEAGNLFDQEWAYDLVQSSVAAVKKRLIDAGRGIYWEIYRRLDLEADPDRPESYAAVGAALSLREDQVAKHLYTVRQDLRQEVLRSVADQIQDPSQVHDELKGLGLE